MPTRPASLDVKRERQQTQRYVHHAHPADRVSQRLGVPHPFTTSKPRFDRALDAQFDDHIPARGTRRVRRRRGRLMIFADNRKSLVCDALVAAVRGDGAVGLDGELQGAAGQRRDRHDRARLVLFFRERESHQDVGGGFIPGSREVGMSQFPDDEDDGLEPVGAERADAYLPPVSPSRPDDDVEVHRLLSGHPLVPRLDRVRLHLLVASRAGEEFLERAPQLAHDGLGHPHRRAVLHPRVRLRLHPLARVLVLVIVPVRVVPLPRLRIRQERVRRSDLLEPGVRLILHVRRGFVGMVHPGELVVGFADVTRRGFIGPG